MSQAAIRNPLLYDDVARCRECPALGDRHVAATGNPTATIMVVGSYPLEEDEVDFKYAWSGKKLGDLWTYITDQLLIGREEVFFTHLLKCKPEKQRLPTDTEFTTCRRHWLVHELRLVRPRIIIAVGKPAWRWLNPEIGIQALEEDSYADPGQHLQYVRWEDGTVVVHCADLRYFYNIGDLTGFLQLAPLVQNILKG